MRHIVVNYDGSGKAEGIAIYVDGKPVTLETLKDSLAGPITADAPLADRQQAARSCHTRASSTIFASTRASSRQLKSPNFDSQEPLRSTLNTLADKRTKQQKDWIRNYYLTNACARSRPARPGIELKALRSAAEATGGTRSRPPW